MTRVRSNSVAMGGVFVTQAVFVFLQIKILTHWLAPQAFGLYSSIFAFGALLGSLAELGFSVVQVRYGAKFEAEGRPHQVTRLLWLAVGLWLAACLLLEGLVLLLAGRITSHLARPEVTPGLLMLGVAALMTFSLRAITAAAIQGRRRMMPALLLELFYMAGLTLYFAVMGPRLNVETVFLGFLGLGLLLGLAGLTVASRPPGGAAAGSDASEPGAGGLREAPALLAEIRTYWLGAFLTTVVAVAQENADRLLLAAMVPLEGVAAWHVAGRMSLFVRKVLHVPQQVVGPELSYKWESGARESVARDLRLYARLEWTLGTVLAVGVALAAPAAVLLASNAGYAAAAPALTMMAAALPLLALQAPLTTLLRSTGHIETTVRSETIWLLSSLAAGALLVGRFGLTGFASGGVVAATLALLYTRASLGRLSLPCPAGSFLALHALLGLGLWGAAALAGLYWRIGSVPAGLARAALAALLVGVLLGRSRLFSAVDRQRLQALFGGGVVGRLVGWIIGK